MPERKLSPIVEEEDLFQTVDKNYEDMSASMINKSKNDDSKLISMKQLGSFNSFSLGSVDKESAN